MSPVSSISLIAEVVRTCAASFEIFRALEPRDLRFKTSRLYTTVFSTKITAPRHQFSDKGMLAPENILSNFEFTCCGK